MSTHRQLENQWIANFRRGPLVDADSGKLRIRIAHQLFYGRETEDYPADLPENFRAFVGEHAELQRTEAVRQLLAFLQPAGISLDYERVLRHLELQPDDFLKLVKRTRYILQTLAHARDDFDTANPFRELGGDLAFLQRLATGEAAGQLHLFEELDLPDLYNRLGTLPPGYGNDPLIRQLFTRIEGGNESFFLTGKAGTGKSTFLHYFAQQTKKKVVITAFTGIAAVNVGGQTLHSFFLFPLKPLLPEDHEIRRFEEHSDRYKIIREMDTLVIDEVSMLRADLLEAIDYSLRINGGNPDRPFGGKQIIFVGDVFQLPPVTDGEDEVEAVLFSRVFRSEYFFDSPAYRKLAPVYFEFRKSHRQQSDRAFVDLLDKVRLCQADLEDLERLNRRFDPSFSVDAGEFVITLTTNNAIARAENARRLRELPYASLFFEATIEGDFREQKYPTSRVLELRRDAQVIFIKNDPGGRWVNGTIAKVDFIAQDFLQVRLQDGSVHKVERVQWENRKFKYRRDQGKIVSEALGTFTQFPVKPAWAITIHKSQGLTFDRVIIDLGRGAFVNGQLYTALSRCRTLDGIVLKRPIRPDDLIMDRRIVAFHETEQLLHRLDESTGWNVNQSSKI